MKLNDCLTKEPLFFVHLDCNVPKVWPDNKPLGSWVATQRKLYKAMLVGEQSSLTTVRRLALENIGFQWVLRPTRTKAPKALLDSLRQNNDHNNNLNNNNDNVTLL